MKHPVGNMNSFPRICFKTRFVDVIDSRLVTQYELPQFVSVNFSFKQCPIIIQNKIEVTKASRVSSDGTINIILKIEDTDKQNAPHTISL